MEPTIVQLQQNTTEWEVYRQSHLNASAAGIIMGTQTFKPNSWDSLLDFYRGKGKPFEGNVATDWGHAHEDEACDSASLLFGEVYHPTVMSHTIDGMPFSASLDGISQEFDESIGHVLEIKCPYQLQKSKTWKLTSDGVCPPQYYWQLQHQIMVSGADFANFFVFDAVSKDALCLVVERNDPDIRELQNKWKEFWDILQAGEMKGDSVAHREDDDFEIAANEWARAQRAIEEAKADSDAARERLIQLCAEQDGEGFGVRVVKGHRKGSVNYKKIPELEGVDLETFRGKDTEFYRVSAVQS